MNTQRVTTERRRATTSTDRSTEENFGVTIPKNPPIRELPHGLSSTAAVAAAAIFRNLDKNNRKLLEIADTGQPIQPRAPLRSSERNVSATSNTFNNRLKSQYAIRKSTNIRANYPQTAQIPLTAQQKIQLQQQKTDQQQEEQRQRQHRRRAVATKVHVVTDEEVPAAMYDKDHDCVYTKLQFLGEGGFARCYQVRDPNGNIFAAKVVAKESLKEEKYRIKLRGEIITHGRMEHPRIVQFHSCFEDDHNVYLIVELCENKTLVEMLKARRHLTEPEVRYYLIQLLDACRYMHDQQVVHRDIKLSNVFLDHKMNIKLGDFGLSAVLKNAEDRKRTICGTPNYIAPEILFSKQGHNQKVDIWALGILMYTLLIGRHPFQMRVHTSIYQRIRDNSAQPSYTFPENIPLSDESMDLISKLLVNNPDDRLSISHILQHPFIQHPELPTRIPLSALHVKPTQRELRFAQRISHTTDIPSSSALQLQPPAQSATMPSSFHDDQQTGVDRKLIVSLVTALKQALQNKDQLMAHLSGTPIDPIVWTKHNAFLSRWVDFTTKYGLGYSISDGEMGVLFNDSTCLSTFDEKTYRYIIHGTQPTFEEFNHNNIPDHLRKKLYLMTNFKEYMNDKLASLAPNRASSTSNGIYLAKYVVTKEAVIFRLSNNLIQFNFFSRPKLMFIEYGSKIIYINRSRQLTMYNLNEAVATGEPELLSLLAYARDTLQSHITNS